MQTLITRFRSLRSRARCASPWFCGLHTSAIRQLNIAALVHDTLAPLGLATYFVCVATGTNNPPPVFLEIAYDAFGAGISQDGGADA